jgi:hypothetical protein
MTTADKSGAYEAGWIDPPNPRHSCYDEQPKHLTREDWQRRWRCSCGQVWRVADSQREGYYFEPVVRDRQARPRNRVPSRLPNLPRATLR